MFNLANAGHDDARFLSRIETQIETIGVALGALKEDLVTAATDDGLASPDDVQAAANNIEAIEDLIEATVERIRAGFAA